MYFGISFQTQMRSQSQIASTMMSDRQHPFADALQPLGAHAARLFRVERDAARSLDGRHDAGPDVALIAPTSTSDVCAAERGIVRRRAEGVVARIGRVDRDLVEHPARPRRHDHDAVGQEHALEHAVRDEDDGEALVLPQLAAGRR